MSDLAQRPNRVPWPPLLVVAAVAAASLLEWLAPLTLPGGRWLTGAGVILVLTGVGLDMAAIGTMRRHRANILPHRPATALVTTGVFAVSRNPIYVANLLLLAGLGLVFHGGWFVVAAGLDAIAVDRLAIRREEAHLAARFGTAWTTYAHRTSRWVTWRVG